MARKTRKTFAPEPTFKGYDDQGEPVFVWPPEIPTWMRAEYVRAWKWDQPRRAPGPERSKP